MSTSVRFLLALWWRCIYIFEAAWLSFGLNTLSFLDTFKYRVIRIATSKEYLPKIKNSRGKKWLPKKFKVLHPLNQEHKSQQLEKCQQAESPWENMALVQKQVKPFNSIAYLSEYKGITSHFLIYPPTKSDRKRKAQKKIFKPLRNVLDHLWTDERKPKNLQIQNLFWLRWFTQNRLNNTTNTAWAWDHSRVMHLNRFRYDTVHIM